MSAFVLLRYSTYQTNAFDLGIFNQSFATTLRGQLFFETPDMRVIPTGTFLAVHFSPLLFAILPLYALAPGPGTLLVLQTLAIGLGSVPVWLISSHNLADRRLAFLVSALFLFNPGVLSLAIYDFHLEAFLPLFLGMLFYSFLAKRWKWYLVFLGLSIVTIEFGPVLAFMIAVFFLLRSLRFQRGAQGARRFRLFSFRLERMELVMIVLTLVISPLPFYGMIAGSAYVSGTAATPGGILTGFARGSTTALESPFWAQFWLILFGTLLFLPLLEPRILVLVLPWFVITLLAVPITFVIIGYQYGGAFVAPYLVWGAALGFRRLLRWRPARWLLPAAVVVSVLVCPLNPAMTGSLPGVAYYSGYPVPTAHSAVLTQAAALIPPTASVLAQNNLFPQVSGRANAYVYLLGSPMTIQYVFADMSSEYYGQPIWDNQTMSQWLGYYLGTGLYGVLVMDDGVVLLEKGYTGPIVLLGQSEYVYDYTNITLFNGETVADSTSAGGMVLSRTPSTPNGTFFYAPYVRVPPGTYTVTLRMKAGSGATGAMLLDAFFPLNASGGLELGARALTSSDFPAPDVWTPITLSFSLPPSEYFVSALMVRGMYAWGGPFYLDTVSVRYVGGP